MHTWPEIRITNWEDFVKNLEHLKLEKEWLSHWVFRGQTNSSWTLKPSILRLLESHQIDRQLGIRFEMTTLREFQTKAHLYEDFKIREYKSGNILLTLTLMQHYGAPTRLLDWTTSPYIALYFAVCSDFNNDGAVFLFNQTKMNEIIKEERYKDDENLLSEEQESNYLNTFFSSFESRRLNSQQGLFSIAANIDKDHETLISNALSKFTTETGSLFCKIIIDKSLKLEFLSRLRTMNAKADQIYPDLYGFCTSLKDLLEIRGWIKNHK